MNKKILLVSLGVIALGSALFMSSGFSSLTSSVLTGMSSDNTTAVMNKRYFVSEDGKNMYTLVFNEDGSRKYSVEIPKEYIESYTDEYGSHEQPIVWPFTDFPREAVNNASLTTDYYLSSAITKWATWYKKEYTQYFEKELAELRSTATSSKTQVAAIDARLKKQQEVVKACTEVTIPAAEKKLSDAHEKLSNDTRDQKLLTDSIATVATKETELSRLLSTITTSQNELTNELNKTIPARLAEIKKIITANDATVKSNTAKITANTKTITANQKKIDTNTITLAANEKKINDNNATIAANEEALKGEMLPAKRSALKTAQAALIKATNTLKTTQENLTKATNTLKETNATLTTKNTELTQANETFATKKVDLITERDTTLPARKTEISTLLTTVWGPYNTLKNEIDTLKKNISKMPTAKEFETKIANDTKAVSDAETAYAKAKTDCETEAGKIAGIQKQLAWMTNWANNLTDKLIKMEAVNGGTIIGGGTGTGTVTITPIDWDTVRDSGYFQSLTDSELQSYIDEITKIINGGVIPGTTTPLTPAQQGNLGNNRIGAEKEKNNRGGNDGGGDTPGAYCGENENTCANNGHYSAGPTKDAWYCSWEETHESPILKIKCGNWPTGNTESLCGSEIKTCQNGSELSSIRTEDGSSINADYNTSTGENDVVWKCDEQVCHWRISSEDGICGEQDMSCKAGVASQNKFVDHKLEWYCVGSKHTAVCGGPQS